MRKVHFLGDAMASRVACGRLFLAYKDGQPNHSDAWEMVTCKACLKHALTLDQAIDKADRFLHTDWAAEMAVVSVVIFVRKVANPDTGSMVKFWINEFGAIDYKVVRPEEMLD